MAKPNDKYNLCGQKKHCSSNCHSKSQKSNKSAHLVVNELKPIESCKLDKVYIVVIYFCNIMHSGIPLNSTATFSDCNFFFSYKEIHNNPNLNNNHMLTRDHNKVPVIGHGTICICTCIGPNSLCNITLDNILYIPKIDTDFISMGTLQHLGTKIKGLNNRIALTKNGNDFIYAMLIESAGTLYKIYCKSIV